MKRTVLAVKTGACWVLLFVGAALVAMALWVLFPDPPDAMHEPKETT